MFISLAMLLGFCSSFIAGLFGGGAGLMTVPSIYWLLVHESPHATHYMQVTLGTGSFLGITMGLVGTWRQLHYNSINTSVLKRFLPIILLGSLVSVFIVDYVNSATLRYFFSVVIFALALWMWRLELDAPPFSQLSSTLSQGLAFSVGFFSSLLGVSIFAVPFLLKLGLDMRKAVGTATVIALAYCFFTCPWYVFLGLREPSLPAGSIGFVNFTIVLAATLPGIVGTYLAVKCVHHLPRALLKKFFVGLMFVVSVIMMLPR